MRAHLVGVGQRERRVGVQWFAGQPRINRLISLQGPAPFAVHYSIMMYLMVVVGGPGYFFGPVIGAAVGVILPEWLRFAQAWYLTVFGFAVVALMIWLPDGLLSIPDRIRARKQSKAASAARAASAKQIGEAS